MHTPTMHAPMIRSTRLSFLVSPTASHRPRFNKVHTTTRVRFTKSVTRLTTPAWRFVLLSDAHIHNQLSNLVEYPLPLTLLSTETLAKPPRLNIPDEEQLLIQPCVRRTITLDGPDGVPLLYASSLWHRDKYNAIMRGRESNSLYHVFAHLRLKVSRAILAVHYGTCDDLCETFGVRNGSTMWARDYVFRQNGTPFLLVEEVLSPRLQMYLGQIVPPEHLRNSTSVTNPLSAASSKIFNEADV